MPLEIKTTLTEISGKKRKDNSDCLNFIIKLSKSRQKGEQRN